jgi:hypothetical protein
MHPTVFVHARSDSKCIWLFWDGKGDFPLETLRDGAVAPAFGDRAASIVFRIKRVNMGIGGAIATN